MLLGTKNRIKKYTQIISMSEFKSKNDIKEKQRER